MLDLQNLKTRMRTLRNSRPDMTVAEMAEVAGVSEATIRRYDDPAHPSKPSFLAVARVCKHYGISMDLLAFGDERLKAEEVPAKFCNVVEMLTYHLTDDAKCGFINFMTEVYSAGSQMSELTVNKDVCLDLNMKCVA